MKNMINLGEAFEDLHDKMRKQIAEKMWEIERVKGFKEKSSEWYRFAGKGAVKKKILGILEDELKERQDNIRVLQKMILEYDKR